MTSGAANVLFVTETFPQASETFILRDLAQLRAQGVGYKVICLNKRNVDRLAAWGLAASDVIEVAETHAKPVQRPALSMPGLRGRLAAFKHAAEAHAAAAAALAIQPRPTRVHALFAGLPVYLARAAAAALNVPFSASIHAGDVYLGKPYYHALLAGADFVCGCNQHVLDALASLLPQIKERLHLVRHGYAGKTPPRPAAVSSKSHALRMLAVGRFVEKKGFHVLVEAVKVLADAGMDTSLTLVGDGEKTRLETLAKALGVQQQVRFAGWLDSGVEEAVARLGPFDALVVPSIVDRKGDMDGVPNVMLEAWSVGLPVVAAHVGGIPEVALDGRNAVLVPPGNAAVLALGIKRLTAEPGLAERLISGGWETLRSQFDSHVNVSAWARLLTAK